MILSLVYDGGVLGFFAARAFLLPASPPPIAAINYGVPFLFAPLVIALPLAALSRSRAAVLVTLAVLVLAVALYGPFFTPRFTAPPPLTGGPLTAMAFNLGADNPQPAQNVAAIAKQQADVVAVEEVIPLTARALRAGLAGLYPYMLLEPGRDTGILSRYPIVASEVFRPAGFGREAVQATLDVNGTPVQVIVVHPEPPLAVQPPGWPVPIGLDTAELERQIAAIAERAATLSGPVVVLGDFNMSDQSPGYSQLRAVLRDSFREAGTGFGFTFPIAQPGGGPGPLTRIDYIFYSRALYVEQADVVCEGGSDHCYVVARLRRVAS